MPLRLPAPFRRVTAPHVVWPAFVVLLLLVSVGVSVAAVVAAHSDGGAEALDDYYARAAAYDSTHARAQASDAQGWQVGVTATSGAIPALRTLHVTVRDRAGRPVNGLAGLAVVSRPQRVDTLARVPLAPDGAGRYRVQVPFRGTGLYDVALSGTVAGRPLVKAVRLSLP